MGFPPIRGTLLSDKVYAVSEIYQFISKPIPALYQTTSLPIPSQTEQRIFPQRHHTLNFFSFGCIHSDLQCFYHAINCKACSTLDQVLLGDNCAPLFIVALFAIDKIWKQPKCMREDDW